MPASDYLDSTETPQTEPRVAASQRRNHGRNLQRPHIPPSYYYFGASDSNSADDTYDLTRECFNIDVESTSELEDEELVEGRHTPPHVELPAEQDEAQFLADQGMQLEQIRELQDRLDEERENLHLLQQTLEHERAEHALGERARERARDVNRRIDEDRMAKPPVFARASQNVVTAAMLLCNMPEPSNPDARRARDEIPELLETAAM
jgi:DNA-binding transcriptional MerR regulator